MGYYTNYQLSIIGGHNDIISKIVGSEPYKFYAIDANGESTDAVKWYEHETDMKEVSKDYPNLVFQLEGEGEEPRGLWIKYFKDGKMQKGKAKITFDDYNESELV